MTTELRRIPVRGARGDWGPGLVIRSSDLEQLVLPTHLREKLEQLQARAKKSQIEPGEIHGYLEHDGTRVTSVDIDSEVLEQTAH